MHALLVWLLLFKIFFENMIIRNRWVGMASIDVVN